MKTELLLCAAALAACSSGDATPDAACLCDAADIDAEAPIPDAAADAEPPDAGPPDGPRPVDLFDHFTIEVTPTSPTQGVDFVVDVQAYSSVDESAPLLYDGTVGLMASFGTLTGPTSVAITGGAASFTVRNDTAGTGCVLTVTDSVFAAMTGQTTVDIVAPPPPTVTNVAVVSTNPDNGIIPYNTGTATVTITGTSFLTVSCPTGVELDDLDGAGAAVGTAATSCTVDSDTQITATFPAGIRTNGASGWNVRVTNLASTNATSAVKFVPVAGLLVSEVYTGTAGNTTHEYLEIYNPTATAIDVTTATGIGLRVHVRNSTGTADTSKALTQVTAGTIPALGFLLVVSSDSDATDAWFASRDYTYADGLVSNGGVYLSLSATDSVQVIDKVGWGTQPAPGFESTAAPNISTSNSIERKPAGGGGHATDTDVNSADFNAQSTTLTPRGSADAPQP